MLCAHYTSILPTELHPRSLHVHSNFCFCCCLVIEDAPCFLGTTILGMVSWAKVARQGRNAVSGVTYPCRFVLRVGVLVPGQSFESVGGGEGDLLLL